MNTSVGDNEELVDDDEVLVMNFWDDEGEWPASTQNTEVDVKPLTEYSCFTAENISEIKSENCIDVTDIKNVLPVATNLQEEFILGPESSDAFAIARRNDCINEDESSSHQDSDVICLDSDTNDAVEISNNHDIKVNPERKLQKATTSKESDISSIIISDVMTAVDECETISQYSSLKQSVRRGDVCKTNSKQKQLFECDICSFSTETRFALSRHKIGHTKSTHNESKEDLINLNKVPNSLSITETTANSSQIHFENIPKTKIFQCKLCSFASKIRFALKRHILKHKTTLKSSDAVGNFKTNLGVMCRYCQFIAKNNAGMSHHVRFIHKSEIKDNILKCRYCSYVAKNNSGLVNHVWRVHSSTAKCTYCLQLIKREKFKEHTAICPTGKLFSCEKCEYKTRYKIYYLKHLENNKDLHRCKSRGRPKSNICPTEKVFSCKKCEFETRNKKLYLKHLQNNKDLHHYESGRSKMYPTEKVFSCEKCEFKTRYKRYYLKHLENNKDLHQCKSRGRPRSNICPTEKVFSCEKCEFETRNKKLYLKHLENNKDLHHYDSRRPRSNILGQGQKDQTVENINILDQFSKHTIENSSFGKGDTTNQTQTNFQTNLEERPKDENDINFGSSRFLYVCEICDYIANQKQELISHKLSHSSLPPIQGSQTSLNLKFKTKFTNNEEEKEKKFTHNRDEKEQQSKSSEPENKLIFLKNNNL